MQLVLSDWGRRIGIMGLLLITALLGYQLLHLRVDFEFEKLFPQDHPATSIYKQHVAAFGYDNDYLQIILSEQDGLFNKSYLSRAIAFEKSLLKIEGVKRVFSPLSLQHVVKSPTGIVIFPLINPKELKSLQLENDSIRIFGNPFYSSTFSKDRTSLSIYINHAHFDSIEKGLSIIDQIEENARLSGISSLRIVGKIPAANVFISYIQSDFTKFLVASLALSFLLLLFLFRNLKAAALPFLISMLSMVWVFGLMALFNIRINLLSSLLPPIILFVSMSDAVHLNNAISKFQMLDATERIKNALQKIWVPTLLTSLTTAIGFLSLLWINTEPVQVLGLFAAIGVLVAFILTFTLGIWFVASHSPASASSTFEIHESWLKKILDNRKVTYIGIGLVLLIIIPGISKLRVDAYLLEDLPASSETVQDFSFVDEHFGGSKPYEVRIELEDSTRTIWDREVMNQIKTIEGYLMNDFKVARVQSPVTIINYLNMVNNGGLNDNYRYPASEKDYQATIRLKNRIDPKRMDKLVTEDSKVGRLIGFIPEWGSRETQIRNQQMLTHLDEVIDSALISYRITGTTHLIDKSHELLSENLLKGLLTAVVIIGLILGVYFKSWKLLVISLVPNLIPLLLIAGIIGWMGISLKMTTAIIFTVAFGIAVDDTIHLMSHYLEGRKTQSEHEAMKKAFKYAGGAMLITSLTMIAGFSLYLFSNFGATFYMGLFVCLSLVLALGIDLTLLPLLLMNKKDNVKKGR